MTELMLCITLLAFYYDVLSFVYFLQVIKPRVRDDFKVVDWKRSEKERVNLFGKN